MTNKLRIRSAAIFFSFCVVYIIIIINLFFIQIWNQHFFSNLADQQYQVQIAQLPPRAPIIDRTGSHYLAMNKECVSAFIMPNQLKEPETVRTFLNNHFKSAADRLEKNGSRSFMYIKRRLTEQELQAIKEQNLSDIHLLQESSRFYPLPCAAPLIGFTDIDNHGCAGIELYAEKQLVGSSSKFFLEKDARSGYFYFKKELQEQGKQGDPVQLTIDGNLQFLMDEEVARAVKKFNAKEAAAVIMNPDNGEILAMSSYPYVDVRNTEHIRMEDTKHRVVSDAYELGSVIKIFAALAALEEGVVTPDELIDCKDTKTCYIDGRKINTWAAHGRIPFYDVIAFSNNIGIAQVAKRLGNTLYDHYVKMGFGKKTGIALPAEASGFVNHPTNWSAQSIISLSYGYEISATLLQLAAAFCMIAHDGVPIRPHILMHQNQSESREPLYSKKSIAAIQDILSKTSEYGTGRYIQLPGYSIMTKTGTANMLVNGKYDPHKNVYTCAAIIQRGDYKRVLVTFIKEAGIANAYAATVAAPLLQRIAEKMIIHEKIV